MGARVLPTLVLAVVIVALPRSAAITSAAADTVVVRWNRALLQAVRDTRMAPPLVARALAVVHTAMFDAWAAYDARAVGTQLGGQLRRPADERTDSNKRGAISFAAHRALIDLFPSRREQVFDPLLAELGGVGPESIPARIGIAAAEAVIAFRHHDGANQLGILSGDGVPYADYTGYAPLNDTAALIHPDRWQPLLQNDGSAQRFLAPHWGQVTPFALVTASQFRPKAPAQYGTPIYERQARSVVAMSAGLDERTKAIAVYWADGPSTETPPGHWMLFAQAVSRRDRHALDDDVKLFFALGNALLDASIAAWDCKVAFDSVRPISAIRFLLAGETVAAWGGPFQGTQLIDGSEWRPYLATPPFAEYVSGHSTFSAAAATVLRRFTGSDFMNVQVTVAAGSSPVEPGHAPATDVTLSWRTFSDAADEAGLSRRLGGIHFRDGDLAGREIGRNVGRQAWEKARTYFN